MDGEDLKQAQVVGGVSDLLHRVEQELGVRISINEAERFGKKKCTMYVYTYTFSHIASSSNSLINTISDFIVWLLSNT